MLNGWYEKGKHLNKIVTLYSIGSIAVGLFSTVSISSQEQTIIII
jgi:hypothetical protein